MLSLARFVCGARYISSSLCRRQFTVAPYNSASTLVVNRHSISFIARNVIKCMAFSLVDFI